MIRPKCKTFGESVLIRARDDPRIALRREETEKTDAPGQRHEEFDLDAGGGERGGLLAYEGLGVRPLRVAHARGQILRERLGAVGVDRDRDPHGARPRTRA